VYSSEYAGTFATPYPTCELIATTTNTATTAKTTSTATTTSAPVKTTAAEDVTTYTVKSALTLNFGSLPENVTAASLAADTTFVRNVASSIATSLGVDRSKVTITKIEVISRRLREAARRQLQGSKLKVEYELVTTSLAEATAVQQTLADPTKAASFSAAFSAALIEKEAASGRAVVVEEIIPEAATVTSKTGAVVTASTAAPATTQTSDVEPISTTVPASPAPTPADTSVPAPAPVPPQETSDEEESDTSAIIGGVVGGAVGLGILVGAAYMWKKRKAEE